MRTNRLERLLKVMQVLQASREVTVEELAKKIGVSRRTIFRDLELLARAGLPYEFDHVTRKYSASKTALLPPVNLTHAEAMALMLSARTLSKRMIGPDPSAAVSAGLKLESMLPAAILDWCGPLVERTEVRGGPVSDPTPFQDIFPTLQSALARRQKLLVRYDSYFERKVIDTTLHPYRLAFIHRSWYLIAYSQEAKKVQTYKVERILQISLLAARYRMNTTFTLDEYFGNAWMMIREEQRHHVKVRFHPDVAGNVDEVRWHKTQQTHFELDKSLIFEVDVDGLREISWWVLGYGDRAEVLEPAELRQILAKHASHLATLYAIELKGSRK